MKSLTAYIFLIAACYFGGCQATINVGDYKKWDEGNGTGNNTERNEIVYYRSWIQCVERCMAENKCLKFAVGEIVSGGYRFACTFEINLDYLPTIFWKIYGTGCYAPPLLTPFLRRQDGSEDFARVWNDYKAGFGDTNGEFWLGLDTLNTLTTADTYDMHVIMEDWIGDKKCSMFESFSVGPEADKYRTSLGLLIRPGSDAGNGMAHPTYLERQLDNRQFSTSDQDNDPEAEVDCSFEHGSGGWWFANSRNSSSIVCGSFNPTGIYHNGGVISQDGVNWYLFNKNFMSLKKMQFSLMEKCSP